MPLPGWKLQKKASTGPGLVCSAWDSAVCDQKGNAAAHMSTALIITFMVGILVDFY